MDVIGSFLIGGAASVGTSTLRVRDATTQATNISASQSFDDSALAIDGVTIPHGVSNGLNYTDNERTCVTFNGAIDHIAGGLPFTSDGRLCVSTQPTAYYSSEIPFDVDGRISVTLLTPANALYPLETLYPLNTLYPEG